MLGDALGREASLQAGRLPVSEPHCLVSGRGHVVTYLETAIRAGMPDDDEEKEWLLMSAQARIAATRSALAASETTTDAALARLEASRKLLDRARMDVIIYGHPHEPEGPAK
jgi:hypothetical protein